MTELLYPSAVICSCGQRFHSDWSADANQQKRLPLSSSKPPCLSSALWLFLRHHAARHASRTAARSVHRATTIMIACQFCSASVDMNRYRQHVATGQCHADASVDEAIRRRGNPLDTTTAPLYKCEFCHDAAAGSLLKHAHRFQSQHFSKFELYLSCRDCQCHVPLCDAVGHAAYWHPERIQALSPATLADLYVAFAEQVVYPDPTVRQHDVPDPSGGASSTTFEYEITVDNVESEQGTNEIRDQHYAGRLFECELCGFNFTTKSAQTAHAKQHAPYRPYRCRVCAASFLAKQMLTHHCRLVHTARRSFTCTICKRSLGSKHSLANHMLRHSGERPWPCRHCGKAFRLREYRTEHERLHTGERPYECLLCDERFHAAKRRNDHVIRVHNKAKPHKCDQCAKAFVRSGDLYEHRKRAHSDERPFACPESGCDKRFKYKNKIRFHVMALHSDERPHKCTHCDKAFVKKNLLEIHLRSHTGERPFRCDRCDKAYTSNGCLTEHRLKQHPTPE